MSDDEIYIVVQRRSGKRIQMFVQMVDEIRNRIKQKAIPVMGFAFLFCVELYIISYTITTASSCLFLNSLRCVAFEMQAPTR